MQTYGYDNLNRIASFQETGGLSQSFGYDPNGHGNMYVSGQTGLGAISAATPQTSSWYTAGSNRASDPSNAWVYDAAGNLQQIPSLS
jgi:hypothetical protein